MKHLIATLLSLSAAGLYAAPAPQSADNLPPKITDPKVFLVADMGDCAVKEGTALFFGIDESEKPAGKFGRAIVNKDGKIAFEKRPDKEVRFFGYNGAMSGSFVKGNPEKTRENIKRRVAMIVAQGYNAVTIGFSGRLFKSDATDLEKQILDSYDFLIAELKKNGVYIQLRIGTWDMGQEGYTFERRDDPKFRCLMGEPVMLKIWKDFAVGQLTRVNPYTGTKLAEDPIVLGVNFMGEMNSGYDRLMTNIPDLAPLGEKEWRKWLKKKYKTIDRLNEAWKQPELLSSFDEITNKHFYKRGAPTRDWYRFIAKKHEQFTNYCRGVIESVGYKGLVWEGDGSRRMSEIYPRAAASDLVPIDIYYCHPLGGWGSVGNKVKQESAVSLRGSYLLTTMSTKINDRPLVIMEHNYCHWNPFVHEGGLLMPAYGAFQGFSQFFIHAGAVIERSGPLGTFSAGASPVMRANEVLTYLLFMRGDVAPHKKRVDMVMPKSWFKEANVSPYAMSTTQASIGLMTGFATAHPDIKRPAALKDSVPKKADLLMAPSGFAEIFSQDWFSDVEVPKGGNFSIEEFAEVMRQKKILPPENISDPKNGVFQTDTGEITMRANESLLKVATPKTEAVTLLAGKGEKIGALEVVSTSENAAIALSSLDGNPISKSSRMLLIFSTEDRNTGETFSNDGVVLLNRGRSPVRLRAAKLELLADLDKSKKFALYPLHSNGERRDKIASVSAAGGKAKISIDTAALKNGPTVFFELAEEK